MLVDDLGRKPIISVNITHPVSIVDIVMIEKLDCILSKRATRPIYMRVQVRLNAFSPYQSQQSSPAIRDITVSGHTRHLRLRPHETHLRLRPVYAISIAPTSLIHIFYTADPFHRVGGHKWHISSHHVQRL